MINGTTWLEYRCAHCDDYHYRNVGPVDPGGVAMRIGHETAGLLRDLLDSPEQRVVQLLERDGNYYALAVVAAADGRAARAYGVALTRAEAAALRREVHQDGAPEATLALVRERAEPLTALITREAEQTPTQLLEAVAVVGLAAVTKLAAPATTPDTAAAPASERVTGGERVLSVEALNKLWGD